MPIGKVWIYRLLFVCFLFVCTVRISLPRIKLAASYFAGWFNSVPGRESPIFVNFVPPAVQNWTNWPAHSCCNVMLLGLCDSYAYHVCTACRRRIGLCGYTSVPEDGYTCSQFLCPWVGLGFQLCILLLKLKLKTNLYSAIKSGDSEALDGGSSQRGNVMSCSIWCQNKCHICECSNNLQCIRNKKLPTLGKERCEMFINYKPTTAAMLTCRSDIRRTPHCRRIGTWDVTGTLPSRNPRVWRQSWEVHVNWLRYRTVECRLAMLHWPTYTSAHTLFSTHYPRNVLIFVIGF